MNNRCVFVLMILLCSARLAAQSGVSEFENIEEITQEGFFKNYFGGLFKGFTNIGEPFNMSGGVGLNMRSYAAFGTENRQDPFFYSLNANLNVRIYKLNLPFSLLVSAKNTDSSLPNLKELVRAFRNNVENKIENQKNRFVRFGTSPTYKWIKLHAGHRSMNFSQFTLANLNFLGGGFELNPGKLRVAGMFGQLAKAEPIDLSLQLPNIPIYERRGWGMKVGYGTNEEYLDLIVFKAEDDINSIVVPEDLPEAVSPAENLVLGLNFQKSFFEKVRLKAEIASSALSSNAVDAPASNQFPHPSFLINGTATTEYRTAFETALDYQAKLFTVGISYRRVDPNYQSLGAYFFNSDIEDYTGNVSFGMLKGKMNVNLSAGIQRDNLDNENASTLTRFIGTGTINYSAGAFSVGLNYNNNSSAVDYVLDPELDSLNVVIVTQDAGITPTYNFQDKSSNQHVLAGSFNTQMVTDDISDPLQSSASLMLTANLTYNYTLTQSQWTFSLLGNFNQNELSMMLLRRYGAGGGITKNFFEGKLNTGLNLNWFLTTSEQAGNNSNLSGNLRMNTNLGKVSINMDWGILTNRIESATADERFAELTGTLGIQYNFAHQPKEAREASKQAKAEKRAARKDKTPSTIDE